MLTVCIIKISLVYYHLKSPPIPISVVGQLHHVSVRRCHIISQVYERIRDINVHVIVFVDFELRGQKILPKNI